MIRARMLLASLMAFGLSGLGLAQAHDRIQPIPRPPPPPLPTLPRVVGLSRADVERLKAAQAKRERRAAKRGVR